MSQVILNRLSYSSRNILFYQCYFQLQTQHEDIKQDFDELKLRHHAMLAHKEKMKYEHEENMTRLRDTLQNENQQLKGK